jgi:hypothetical protein
MAGLWSLRVGGSFWDTMSNSDYTLLEFVLSLGGRVVKVDRDPGGVPCAEGTGGNRVSPLSTAHISPFLEYRMGASVLKAHRGGMSEQVGGGKRGDIKGFSYHSRRRLMLTIGAIRRDAELPAFVTLTYPEKFPAPGEAKKHLDIFFKRLARGFDQHGSIWKLEPQQRGAPHFHVLTWGANISDLAEFVPSAWFKIAGGGDEKHLRWHLGEFGNQHCVQPVHSWRGVWSYASKYLGKTFEVSGWSDKWTGRYWGLIKRGNVPFGELVQENVTRSKAVEVMRYQRRFSGLKSKGGKSLTIFCDAEQWIQNLKK